MALEIQDWRNIVVLLQRATYNGMDEAEAGVVLKQKVLRTIQEIENPPVVEETPDEVTDTEEETADGGDIQGPTE